MREERAGEAGESVGRCHAGKGQSKDMGAVGCKFSLGNGVQE